MKALEGRYKGLLDKNVMDKKRQDEEDFRAKVMANAGVESRLMAARGTPSPKPTRKAASRVKEQLYRSARFAARQHWRRPSWSTWPRSRSRMASGCAGYHDAQLDSLRYRMFSPRAHLSGDGDRAHGRRAGAVAGRTGAERSVPEDRAERPHAEGSRHGAGERHEDWPIRRCAASWWMAARRPWRPPPIP